MKTGRKTLAVIVALMMLLSVATMMASCAGNTPTDPSTSMDSSSTAEPTTSGAPVNDDDEAIALDFGDGLTAAAEVKQSRKITVRSQSNYLLIKGSGKFTVKYTVNGEEKSVQSDENNEVNLENTADVYTELVLTIEVDAAQTLSFTLVHNPGTEPNPYEIAASGDTKVTYTEGVFIKITDAGWYNIVGNEFFLTNYIVGDSGVTEYKAYLPAGTYGISAKDKTAESSVTVSRVNAPEGYSEETRKTISELGDAKLVLFKGTKLYFEFVAPEDGLYVFSTGSEGKGANCRFAVSADDYATHYGKYYENGEWLTCEGGKNYALHMVQDGTVTIVIDYTADDNMVGSDEVSINISVPKVVDQLDELVSNTLEKNGKAYFSFTAGETGTYTVQLGLGNTNNKSRIQIWTRELAEGREDAVTYEWVKGDYCDGIAYVKLEADETIYIVVDSEKNAYGNVSVQVSAGAEEPLPSEGWESGVYKCDDAKIQLDRDAKTVALGNLNAVRFYYLDGKATFTANEVAYTLEMAENGKDIVLSYVNDESETVSYTLVKIVPVEISKWQGVYVDADGNELTIFQDGAGIIDMKRYIIGDSGTKFTAKENLLAWSGDYIIEINELSADGRVASVKVSVKKGTAVAETVIYTLKSADVETVPEYLPIGNDKYVGGNDYIIVNGTINGSDVVVLKKIDDNTYMVSAVTSNDHDRILMKVVIEENDGKVVTIKLYNEKDELLSELAEPVIVATPDLKADGSQQDKSKRDESYDGMYYVKIPASGWYTFYGEEGVEIFSASEVDGKASADWSTKCRLSTAGVTKQYNQGDVIAFYNGNFTASYSETEPVSNDPGTENNPYEWDGSDLKLDSVRKESTDRFYISFTPSASGTYTLKFTHSEYSNEQINVFYNGAEYGRWWNDDKGSWGDWEKYDNRLPVQMKLTAGEEISFSIAYGRSNASGWTMSVEFTADQGGNDGGESGGIWGTYTGSYPDMGSYTITIYEDGTLDFTCSELGDKQSGLKWTLSGETYSFNYIYSGKPSPASFTISGNTMTLDDWGNEITLTKAEDSGGNEGSIGGNAGTYIGTDEEGSIHKITIDANGTLTYIYSYYRGWGNAELVEEIYADLTVVETENGYKFSGVCDGYEVECSFYFDGNGDIVFTYNEYADPVTLKKQAEGGMFSADQQGTYTGFINEEEYTFVVNGNTIDIYDDYGEGVDEAKDVSLEYDGEWYTAAVTVGPLEWDLKFKFVDGKIYFTIDDFDYFYLSKEDDASTGTNYFDEGQEGTYVGSDSYGVSYELTINADGTVSYEDSLGYAVENAIVEQSRDMLWLQFDLQGITVSIRFTNEDGTQITMILDEVTVTLEKESAADSDGMFSAEQQGEYTVNFGVMGSASLTINSDSVTFVHMNGGYSGEYNAETSGDGYLVELDYGDYLVFAFEDGGLNVNYNCYGVNYNGTATKA